MVKLLSFNSSTLIYVDIYTIAMLMSFENLIKADLRFLKREDRWSEDEWMKIKHQDQKRGFCFASFKYKKENDKNYKRR